MRPGEFVWVQPMRNREDLEAAVILKQTEPLPAHRIKFRNSSIGWRVALLESLFSSSEPRIFEAVSSQIVRKMSPLEAIAWSLR